MSITRRRMLWGTTALTAAVLTRRFTATPDRGLSMAPDDAPTVAGNVLLLHDGGPAGLALAWQLHGSARKSARGSDVADRAVAVLTLQGFKEAGVLIESSRGGTLVALLNDAETLVVDALLKVRGAAELDRRRYGRQVLLTARL